MKLTSTSNKNTTIHKINSSKEQQTNNFVSDDYYLVLI